MGGDYWASMAARSCVYVGAAFILRPPPWELSQPTAHESYIEICYPQVRNCQQHTVYDVDSGGTAIFIFMSKQVLAGTDVDADL